MPKKTYKENQREWKRDHYGMSHKKFNEWNREYSKAQKLAKKRDNNTCQTCFGEHNKIRVETYQKLLVDEKLRQKYREEMKIEVFSKHLNMYIQNYNNDYIEEILSEENLKKCIEHDKKIRLQVHHIKDVIDGGSNDLNNLLTVCSYCHYSHFGQRGSGFLYQGNQLSEKSFCRKIRSRYKKILKSRGILVGSKRYPEYDLFE